MPRRVVTSKPWTLSEKTMNHYRSILLCAVLAFAAPSWAGPADDALIACLADSTTGRDRKDLARWLFVAMTSHPEMKELSSVTPQMRDEASQSLARILTRLMTENCTRETRATSRQKVPRPQALGKSFESLGALAMQELTAHQEVRAAIQQIDRFVDRRKVEAAITPD